MLPVGCRVADVLPAGAEKRSQHLPVEYSGRGESFVRTIANLAYGGQVVLTEPAWVSVQDHIPGQAQVRGSLAPLWSCSTLLLWLSDAVMQVYVSWEAGQATQG